MTEIVSEKEIIPKKGNDSLIVKAKVREYIHEKECNTSGDVVDGDALNNEIKKLLDKAIERAKANGRKTVQTKDL